MAYWFQDTARTTLAGFRRQGLETDFEAIDTQPLTLRRAFITQAIEAMEKQEMAAEQIQGVAQVSIRERLYLSPAKFGNQCVFRNAPAPLAKHLKNGREQFAVDNIATVQRRRALALLDRNGRTQVH